VTNDGHGDDVINADVICSVDMTVSDDSTVNGPNDLIADSALVGSIGSREQQAQVTVDCSHVQFVIDRLPDSLTAEQREQAIALIRRNADVFSTHECDLGCSDLLTARVPTGSHRPIAEPLRRHAQVHLYVIDKAIQKMKQAGVVEEASSPWSANLVLVAKKDELGRPVTPRITIDFRGLNFITYQDKFSLPHIQDCLRTLDRAAYISLIDLANSYLILTTKSRFMRKTAIN